ncbi:MAG: hypothetical protein ABEL51_02525 [Salinibacter sp.]
MPAPYTKKDWKARIQPHLSRSLRAVSDTITRTEAVQQWLHDASLEAAEGLGGVSGMQGEMQGYMRMLNALEDRFPNLLDAVNELTEGCGTVDLHWRPMNPNFSRVQVTFERDFTVKLFVRLDALSPETARSAIETVGEALPEGKPFPNRPNTVTGIVAHDGACLGVRAREHFGDEERSSYRTVTLLPENRSPVENLSVRDAAVRLRQLLAADESAGAD